MWVIGAIVGALLGAMLGQVGGFFVGGVLGGLAAWMLFPRRRDRLAEIERRLSALEEALAARAAGTSLAPTPVPEPLPELQVQPGAALEREVTLQARPESAPVQVAPPVSQTVSAPPPPREPEPVGPSFWERLFTGNLVVKVGVVVLFFGVAFLL